MALSSHPMAGGFGAVVDFDLSQHARLRHSADLAEALQQHRLLIFPDQHLNHADILAVSEHFGTVDTDVDSQYAVSGFPGITVISNLVENGVRVGIYDGDNEEEWHADNSFKPLLSRATVLYSVITPEQGGQTRFSDTTQAYADLPAELKERLEGLRAVHSVQRLCALQGQANGGHSSAAVGSLATHPEVEHPLVLEHPVTGARSLLLGSMVISRIDGLDNQNCRSLLADLLGRATSGQYVYTHRWRQGDFVVWDNFAVLHTASPCDSSRHHRLLYRTSVR
ncbi:taurine dioxygenase [Parafrankia irregularis]|uniref:Taurine dioxygenase n=1 Tax=Parafrankia irregularis TaxID=795642 RepID=A0A0S4QZ46_9ACTN|nr:MULTISPECIES: TauD/TfdA family dioxygenase [Frankiaceae]KPM50368.1 taurine catabolism dioxygenase [Frankia sp. R43]MBE3204760.1 TauD/TfdA family dioxygenase [Parafrankia sp. CH37]CUU60913.1 taurine dioxygenase [Parafrankia irregularis]